MYENITYEQILNRMLARVPNDLDKREGSVIYTALAPAAAELRLAYFDLDTVMKETFADSASRENLIKRVSERGITPYPATAAVLKAAAVPDTVEIEIGERFNLGSLNYIVTEKLSAGCYQMACESPGAIGGSQLGAMIPIQNIPGLETMTLVEVLLPGTDEESVESILDRYHTSFKEQAYGGNRQDYLDKTHKLIGGGGVKVTRAWNGPSTVKLTILDSSFHPATETLIRMVQEAIDPTQDGEGVGLAPIDHIVTVDTAEAVSVAVQAEIMYETGYDYPAVANQIDEAVERYLSELRAEWEEQDHLVVRIRQIEARILDVPGIMDIGGTTLNGGLQNLELTKFQVPVYGGIQNG